MENCVQAMMRLIANEVCGAALNPADCHFEEDDLIRLYRLSKAHDLAHLVGDALIRNRLLPDGEVKAKFEKQMMTAVFRYERINYDLNRLKEVLNEAGIPFVPLKGSVLRQYYPEPWMRTSCDIDLLVREDDLNQAAELLTGKLEYRQESKGSHDIGLFSPGGVHVELHYTLIESNIVCQTDRVLERVWDSVCPTEEAACCLAMTDEMFYFYHIAHMAKHFQIGGCGVRPFLDLWILNHRISFDSGKRDAVLQNGGLLSFAQKAQQLSEVWFEGAGHTEVSLQMERYLLCGGVYGNYENRMLVHQVKHGGKIGYAISRIWLPYGILKSYYPSLEGKKILLPLYEIRRWGKLLFRGGVKRSFRELKRNSATPKEDQLFVKTLLSQLGLDS